MTDQRLRAKKQPEEPSQRLLSLSFLLLFFQATCCNCYIAVFYCMEQWMASIAIPPSTRGLLLAVLAIVVFVTRPIATWLLYGHNKTIAMVLSVLIASASLVVYPYIPDTHAVPIIFCLRALQGLSLAVYSSCTTSLLVACIPKGQSARGFALFSLTLLIPFAVLPALGEGLINFVGGEAKLFAATALLGIPALATLPLLKEKLADKRLESARAKSEKALMWHSLRPRNLGLIYFACLTFSIMTNEAIFFMKGLCQTIDAPPAAFFTTYTTTIMVIRLIGNCFFDRFRRYPVMLICAFLLAVCTAKMSHSNGHELIVLSMLYGAGLGLLYPLLAAQVCDRSSPEIRPLNTNLMMAAFDLSSCIAPMLGGLILHFGFDYAGVFISTSISISLCGASIFLDMLLERSRRA